MDPHLDPTLLDYLSRTNNLPREVCARLVLEILAQYSETLEAYVKRRHTELKATTQLKNEQIYDRIVAEIPSRRFAIGTLSTRQVRRLIYG